MNRNTLLVTTLSIIGMMVFLVAAYMFTSASGPAATEYQELKSVRKSDHTKWSKNNKILFIEYSDFQCPACGVYYNLIKNISDDADSKKILQNVTLVYRHFPLDSAHKNARSAAHAAEAAGLQGKFFEFHDLLFEKQPEWSETDKPEEIFTGYAKSLKLDLEKFKTDMNSKTVKDIVQADLVSGRDFDVQGTPTFFLNGKKIDNPPSIEELKKVLLEGIK